MYTILALPATSPIASAEALLISPRRHATLSRSISFCALVTAAWGVTLSSASRSTLRPSTPPDALTSSTASVVPRSPYCPSWPRKPVRGVRWPILMVSACALTIAGKPSDPAAAATPIAAVFLRALRRVIDVGDAVETRVLRDLCADMRPPPGWNPDLALCYRGLRVNGRL